MRKQLNNSDNEKVSDPSVLRTEILSAGRHSLIYVVGQALSRAVGFFMIPVYTRFIAPSNYGAMELIEIICFSLALSISMGAAHSMWRFYYAAEGQRERNQVISTIILGYGSIALPIVVLCIMFSGFISRVVLAEPQYQYYLRVALATVWFGMFFDVGLSYLRMLYMAKLFVVVTTIQLAIALALNIWFVVFLRLDILGIFYSTLITHGLAALCLTAWMLRRVGLSFSPRLLKSLIKFGVPLIPSRIGLMLGFVSNRFFLRWHGSLDPLVALTQVGLFSLGHKFGVIISRFVNVPVNSFWAPRRMELLLRGEPAARETVARVCTYGMMCSTYLALIISSGAESLIEIMAHPSYEGAHVVVPFVAFSYVVLGLEHHFVAAILYKKKTVWSTYASILSLAVILIWMYIFVPIYGLIGAATANLVGFSVRISFIYIASQRLFPIPFELDRILKLISLAIIFFFFSQLICFGSPYATFFVRTAFVALFPVLLLFFRFYKEGELVVIYQYFLKRNKTDKLFSSLARWVA